MAAAQECLATNRVSRTAPEVRPTAIMLFRFRMAINIMGETWADVWLILFALRFDFGGVFARIAFPEKGGSGAWWPDPDAFPVEVSPRSASHHVMGWVVKA